MLHTTMDKKQKKMKNVMKRKKKKQKIKLQKNHGNSVCFDSLEPKDAVDVVFAQFTKLYISHTFPSQFSS